MNTYNLIVIGAGPGGYMAAIKAAKLGKRVAVIENREVGGTCLNRGCIPTKTLLHSSELLRVVSAGELFGITAKEITVDMEKLFVRKQEVVSQLRKGIQELFKKHKIDIIKGTGIIRNKNEVNVKNEIYSGDYILIATGGRPVRPNIPGILEDGVVTSDELLEDGKDYKSLIVIGGGVIGVEFANIYNALGCNVTILEAQKRILPGFDKDISQNLTMILKKRGVSILTGVCVNAIKKENGRNALMKGELTCYFTEKDEEKKITGEGILVSIGRTGNLERLFGEGVNIKTENGWIVTDETYQTSLSGVYAIGDIIKGGIPLAHMASSQGINTVCSIFGHPPVYDLKTVPSCVYTEPEIASVGITESEAKEKEIPVIIGKSRTGTNGKSIITNGDRGFAKLIFSKETKVLLGAQLMCSHATDMIGGLCQGIVNHLTLDTISLGMYPHPSISEIIGEALEYAKD